LRLELDVFVDSAQTSRGACAWVGKAGSLTRARAGQDGPAVGLCFGRKTGRQVLR